MSATSFTAVLLQRYTTGTNVTKSRTLDVFVVEEDTGTLATAFFTVWISPRYIYLLAVRLMAELHKEGW